MYGRINSGTIPKRAVMAGGNYSGRFKLSLVLHSAGGIDKIIHDNLWKTRSSMTLMPVIPQKKMTLMPVWKTQGHPSGMTDGAHPPLWPLIITMTTMALRIHVLH